jgi:hypothetical protein
MTTLRPGSLLCGVVLAFCWMSISHGDELPPPETVRSQLRTVAVSPVYLPLDVPRREEVQHRLEQALEARFAAAGITVIPASTRAELEGRIRAALGGVFDPHTGEPDRARAAAYDEHVWSEMRRLHPADAWVQCRVEVRRANASGAYMAWDGVDGESSIGSPDPVRDMFKAPQAAGGLRALSLVVVLTRPDHQVLYGRYGGLQPIEYFGEASAGKKLLGLPQQVRYVPVDRDALMTDPAREQRALSLALDPLLLSAFEREANRAQSKAAWKAIAPVPIAAPPPAPPAADRTSFLANYPRVVVAAPAVPDIPNRAAVRERYLATITEVLVKTGFTVLPADAYAAVWEPIYTATGGFYDPFTGEFLTAKRDAAIREALARLGTDSPVDAVVVPTLGVRQAEIDRGQAKWDGLSLPLGKGGALFDKSRQYGGNLSAASLHLRFVDAEANEVYQGFGAIELLERFKAGGMMSAGTFEDVPRVDWFGDPSLDGPAVQRALGPLAGPPAP